MRRIISIVAVAATFTLLAGCGGAGSSPAATSPAAADTSAAPPASHDPAATPGAASSGTDLLADVDMGGGRTMHLLCVGPTTPGRPTVIFESGLGGDAGQWSDVIHELDGSVRACAYDRAGDGQSPPVAGGRTTTDQVADLRALLTAAKIPPPYVLVGYSVGGWNVMVHADEHPDDVVGAVFVDVRPPAASQRWLEALPPEASGEPEAIHLTRTDPVTFEQDPAQNPEGLLIADSAAEALGTDDFRDAPLVVLAAGDTSGVSEGFDATLGATMVRIYWELQEELAARSTAGKLVKVDGATHEMPFERPDAIADAIREVLGG